MKQALRGLDSRNADVVGQHLVAAGGLLEEDPDTALAHARAARDRASRIAAVREAVGVAAYHAGDFGEAARELRAYKRMSGDESYRAVLADCERALGRPEIALRLVGEALAAGPEAEETVELQLVEAGARQDLDELPAAALVLEGALGGRPVPDQLQRGDLGQLRLATAYADLLVTRGDAELADQWFAAIMAADPDDETGVAERFDGIEFDEDDEDDGDEDDLGDDDLGDDDAEDGSETAVYNEEESDDDAVPVTAGAGDDVPAADDVGVVEDEAPTGQEDTTDDAPGDTDLGGLAGDGMDEDPDVGPGYDPDEDDIEAEVAELLGEIPVPGFSDDQTAVPVTPAAPRPAAGHTGLFSAANDAADPTPRHADADDEDEDEDEQDRPTN